MSVRDIIASAALEEDADREQAKGRASYSSPLIRARRRRILIETQKVISERGLNSVAIDDIARRANVAKRTIYNAFHSKEALIAAAVQQYYGEFAASLRFETDPLTVDGAIERLAVIARRNITQSNYIKALLSSYFTPDIAPEIRSAIHDVAAALHTPWIEELHRKHQLQSWVNPDELRSSLVFFRFSMTFPWLEGKMPDDEFVIALARNFLTIMVGATRGKIRRELEERLAALHENPFIRRADKGQYTGAEIQAE